jgi:hypothetical protein
MGHVLPMLLLLLLLLLLLRRHTAIRTDRSLGGRAGCSQERRCHMPRRRRRRAADAAAKARDGQGRRRRRGRGRDNSGRCALTGTREKVRTGAAGRRQCVKDGPERSPGAKCACGRARARRRRRRRMRRRTRERLPQLTKPVVTRQRQGGLTRFGTCARPRGSYLSSGGSWGRTTVSPAPCCCCCELGGRINASAGATGVARAGGGGGWVDAAASMLAAALCSPCQAQGHR